MKVIVIRIENYITSTSVIIIMYLGVKSTWGKAHHGR